MRIRAQSPARRGYWNILALTILGPMLAGGWSTRGAGPTVPTAYSQGGCLHCTAAGPGYHQAQVDGWNLDDIDHGAHAEVLWGYCGWDDGWPKRHPFPCGAQQSVPSVIELQQLRAAVNRAETTVIARLMARYPQVIELNEGRGAIQVIGCDSSVAVHLPLPEEVASSLIGAKD